jgi:hypothetical protein
MAVVVLAHSELDFEEVEGPYSLSESSYPGVVNTSFVAEEELGWKLQIENYSGIFLSCFME